MAHLVIAEDDSSLRSFLTLSLERAGHRVAAHPDGLSAHDWLTDLANPCDLLVTDVVMPGMDGVELAMKATRLRPGLAILYITGFGMAGGENAPTGQVMAKPLHLSSLLAEIERRVGRPEMGSAPK
jgi:two-component system cell cycle response regulator CpdR